MQRKELTKIFHDTINISTKLTTHSFKQSEKWNYETDVPPEDAIFSDYQPNKDPARITVINRDTITETIALVKEGLCPLVLNMACDTHPGGGVKNGARAQEEDIFRCSNYELCVNKSFYPINDNEFITTSNVCIVKDSNYIMLDDFFTVDFIAVAAVKRPLVSDNEYLINDDYIQMRRRIDGIFRYAIYQEQDTLLLGALGCGAYRNPSYKIALLFKEFVEKYKYFFKEIRFAVLSNGKNQNYEIFYNVLHS